MKDFKKVYVAGAEDGGWRGELKKTLQHWIKCMEQFASYEQLQGNYTPFWYNERAHVGFLAGGAWRANRQNFALEEFRTQKQKGKGKAAGRGDLLLKLDDTLLCCECKAVRARITATDKDPWTAGRKSLVKARRDVLKVSLRLVDRSERAGITFISPTLGSAHTAKFTELRNGFVQELKRRVREDPLAIVPSNKKMHTDFWAAYFPAWAENTRMIGVKKGKRWPGVLLLGTTLGFERAQDAIALG